MTGEYIEEFVGFALVFNFIRHGAALINKCPLAFGRIAEEQSATREADWQGMAGRLMLAFPPPACDQLHSPVSKTGQRVLRSP